MSDLAIKVENVSKLYRLGDVGTGTLGEDITRFWAQLRGKEDPFSKIANANDRSQKSNSDYVWSLRDIDFEVKKGDAVGIIGRNGAGKSTLLKVLSRITAPTTGRVRVDGRVASLLEVGTGFSPDLTGRQNIYMNGAILGMTRAEVSAKMDEIIDFSGVEGYIDTPVKRYSSGMYVRLAFAVAAHLDPEIMIVDEVLAVGDAEFQKKCLGKMESVNKGEGRTVLFVSHSMTAIQALCKSAIFLKNGHASGIVTINEAVKEYLYGEEGKGSKAEYFGKNALVDQSYKGSVQLLEARLLNEKGEITDYFKTHEDIIIEIKWENMAGVKCSPNFQMTMPNETIAMIGTDSPVDWDGTKKQQKGIYLSKFKISKNLLNANDYLIAFALDCHSPRVCFESHKDALKLTIFDPMDENCIARGMFTSVREDAVLWPALECNFQKIG